LLLHAFNGIRSERLLLEQLHYNLLFRWFVGLSLDEPIWHPTTFTKTVSGCPMSCSADQRGETQHLENLMGAPEQGL
jgi:hypothetical protein